MAEQDSQNLELQLKQAEANLEQAGASMELLQNGSTQEELRQSEASLKMAQASYDQAKSNLERYQQLVEAGVVAQTELETARINYTMIYAGVGKQEMAARAKDALQWVGLSKYLHHYPNQMSGGQQQRVAIARALVNNPSLILADEPTGALDSRTSVEIVAVIQRLNQKKGITVVMVTHEKDIAQYCRRLVTLKDGHIIEDAPVLNPRSAAEDLAALPVEAEVGL